MRIMQAATLLLSLLCVLSLSFGVHAASGSGTQLPSRPAPPSHGRFGHRVSEQPTRAARRRGVDGEEQEGEAARPMTRRFQHAMVVDLDGSDVTDLYSLPDSFSDSKATAAELASHGLSVLKYDVSYSPEARVVDEDENVLQVECSSDFRLGAHTLLVTAADPRAALDRYSAGSVVHGSDMWCCVDAAQNPWTILVKVAEAELLGEHSVALRAGNSSYAELFDEAHVLLQQPTLLPRIEEEGNDPQSPHPMSLGSVREVRLQTEQQMQRPLQREQAKGRRMRTMRDDLRFVFP